MHMNDVTPDQPALQDPTPRFSLGGSSQLLILTAALIVIFLFFAVTIGLKKASEAREDNDKVVASMVERGMPESEARQSDRLLSPWDEGTKAAFNFVGKDNRETMARQTAIVGTAALGMTLIIILGGIDLAVGSVIALASVVVASMLASAVPEGTNMYDASISGWWIVLCAMGGIGAGIVTGMITGSLVTGLKMMPFIVTLGMLGAVRGAAKGFGDNQKVDAPETWLNNLLSLGDKDIFSEEWPAGVQLFSQVSWVVAVIAIVGGASMIFHRLYQSRQQRSRGQMIGASVITITILVLLSWLWFGMQYWAVGIWVMLWLAAVVAIMLRYTRLGRHIFAIGSNEQTARLCGVAINKVKLTVYGLGGFFAGVAGVMQFSRLGVGDPTVAVGKELDVIAAVVIGGGSLSGGEGMIAGSLIGAMIMTVIRIGCTQLGLPNWVQEIVTGAIIVAAVALDRLRHRRV